MGCNCFRCPLCEDTGEYIYDTYNIWCNKVGSKCGYSGYCDDAFSNNKTIHKPKSNKKHSNKRTRRNKYQNRLRQLERITYLPSPTVQVTEKWDKELGQYIPLDKPYYKRCYRSNHSNNIYKYFKRYSNKKVRYYKGDLLNGSAYKKIYDYRWYWF